MKEKTVKDLITDVTFTIRELSDICAEYIGNVLGDQAINQVNVIATIYMDEDIVLQKINYMVLGAEEFNLLEDLLTKHMELYVDTYDNVSLEITIVDMY